MRLVSDLFSSVQLTFIRGRLHGCCWYLIVFAIPSRNPLKVYYMRYDLYSIQCSLRLFGAGYMDAVGIWYVFRLLNLKLSRNPLKVYYMRYDRYSIQEPPEGVLHEIRSLFHPVQLTFIRGRLHGCCWYLIAIPCHEICCMHNQLIWFVWSVFQCSLRLFGAGYMDAVGIWYVFRLLNLKLSRNPLKVYYMRYDLYSIQCSLRLFGAGYMDAVGIWYVFLVMRYDLYSIQEPPEGVLHEIRSLFHPGTPWRCITWDLLYAYRLHGCCWYLICFPGHEICCMHNQLIWFDLICLICLPGYEICCMLTGYMRYDRYSMSWDLLYAYRLHGCCWYLIAIPCHEICCMHNQLIWFDLSDLFASAAYVYSGPVTWMLLVSDRYSIQEPPEGVLHEIRSLFHPVQLTFIRGRLHGCCWYLICFPIT